MNVCRERKKRRKRGEKQHERFSVELYRKFLWKTEERIPAC
jgi:hypothetical protein